MSSSLEQNEDASFLSQMATSVDSEINLMQTVRSYFPETWLWSIQIAKLVKKKLFCLNIIFHIFLFILQ
jgi:hypothetical protein